MIRFFITAIGAAAMLMVYSCKKSKNLVNNYRIDSPIVLPPLDYTMMKPGNYWIYQNYRLDSINGAAHPQGNYDSCYVEKDTIINDKTYHKYMTTGKALGPYGANFFRDSLSYMINDRGQIVFSYEDFSVLNSYLFGPNAVTSDTIYVTEQMFSDIYPTTVAAGTFKTITFKQNYRFPPGAPFGRDRAYQTSYAKGVGIVKKTTGFYTILPDIYQWRLERYHIAP